MRFLGGILLLETDRLHVRKVKEVDLDGLLQIFGDRQVMDECSPLIYTSERMSAWITNRLNEYESNGIGNYWLIQLRSTSEIVGIVGLPSKEVMGSHAREIRFITKRSYWRTGIATEASAAIRDFAFSKLALKTLISIIPPENLKAIGVVKKLGLKYKTDATICEKNHAIFEIENPNFSSLDSYAAV
jgi:RimJ/RimL family protein N-acetyltransferase